MGILRDVLSVPGIPVLYFPAFILGQDQIFSRIWTGLDWEQRPGTPRKEYYCNEAGVEYTYGKGAGRRTYEPRPWTTDIRNVQTKVEKAADVHFEICFLNGYADGQDQLGWHADDSPEMDDARPIAVVSLGARREIWFCPQSDKTLITKLWLDPGSLCLMKPGMQDTHFHRIPKASTHGCGPRVSLTFRGCVETPAPIKE